MQRSGPVTAAAPDDPAECDDPALVPGPARDPSAAAGEAWRLVHSLVLEGEAHARLQDACREVGLTMNMFKAMLTLDRVQPLAMRELADYFNIDASYCTNLVDGLEAQGIAERQPHPTDRRVKMVVLTDQGRQVLAQARTLMGQPPPAFCSLTRSEQRQLRDLLAKVAGADTFLSS